MRWAPGAGIKNSEFIDRWDVDVGVAFIPWEKLPSQLDSITEGSIVDEDSLPADFARGMLSCFLLLGCLFTYRYCFISLMPNRIVWLIMEMMIVIVTLCNAFNMLLWFYSQSDFVCFYARFCFMCMSHYYGCPM